MTSVPVRHLFDLAIDFEQMQVFSTPLGTRMVAVIRDGRAEGPALTGRTLPGGGDWLLVGADGIARLDIRATVVTDDGHSTYLTGLGRVSMLDGARDRFLLGDAVRGDEMLGRIALVETAAGITAGLDGTVAVGTITELAQTHIHYQVHALT